MNAVMPVLIGRDNLTIQSCEVTEKKMYIKLIDNDIHGEIKGRKINAGLSLSNSETGLASLRIEPFTFDSVCTNGMIMGYHAIKKYHIGGRQGSDEIYNLLSNETKDASDKAFWMETRDVLNAVMGLDTFNEVLARYRDAANSLEIPLLHTDKIITKVLENKTSDTENESIVKYLAEDKDFSQWGLASAITRASQDADNYDRATDLEYLGGQVIDLTQNEWHQYVQ